MPFRAVQNADITLDDCMVEERNRLTKANSFRDFVAVLRMTRAGVAWEATNGTRPWVGQAQAAPLTGTVPAAR